MRIPKLLVSPVMLSALEDRGIDGYGSGVLVTASAGTDTRHPGSVVLTLEKAGTIDASGKTKLVIPRRLAERLALDLIVISSGVEA